MPRDNITEISKATQFKSGSNAVENGRKGGIANGRTHRKRKTFKKVFDTLLPQIVNLGPLDNKENESEFDRVIKAVAENNPDITYEELMAMALIFKASTGDSNAFVIIRDTIGERPADKQELSVKELPKVVIKRRNEE